MSLSRRYILGALMASAGTAAGAFSLPSQKKYTSISSIPKNSVFGFGVRKDAHTLTADSPDVRIYREGVRRMKELSESNPLDPMGWAQHWAHHSLFCATSDFDKQVHYGWYFLPWHRAYLFVLEQKIRRMLDEPTFALPYWDWTRNPSIPPWYFGADNPLNNTTRMQGPTDKLPSDFTHVSPAMRAQLFSQFGGRRRSHALDQIEGTLEQGVHNCVHNWIGGEMASFSGAGNDPLFQSQHGQIDRLWSAWTSQDGDRMPSDTRWRHYPFFFYGPSGEMEIIYVEDVIDTEKLGYSYDRLDFRPTLTAANRPMLSGGRIDLGKLTTDPAFVAGRANYDPSTEFQRAILTYDRMTLPHQPYHHRLYFVEADDPKVAHYVTTHTILPIPGLETGLEMNVNSQIEIPTSLMQRIIEGATIRVVGEDIPLKGRPPIKSPVPFTGVGLNIQPRS